MQTGTHQLRGQLFRSNLCGWKKKTTSTSLHQITETQKLVFSCRWFGTEWKRTWLWLEALVVTPGLLEQLLEMGLAVRHTFERGIVAQLSKAKRMNTEIVRPCTTAYLCLDIHRKVVLNRRSNKSFHLHRFSAQSSLFSEWEMDKTMISPGHI